jgi:hypothetical protein
VEGHLLLVLSEWLHENNIDLDRPPVELAPAVEKLSKRWDTVVLVLTDEHKRRYARASRACIRPRPSCSASTTRSARTACQTRPSEWLTAFES